MFTGIVEETGILRSLRPAPGGGGILTARCRAVLDASRIGDSIAVNGVCLTVSFLAEDGFSADVMPETLRRSNLGLLSPGARLNLERAMPADGRFGGHLVTRTHRRKRQHPLGLPRGKRRLVHNRLLPRNPALDRTQGLGRRRRHQPDGGRYRARLLQGVGNSAHRRPDQPRRTKAGRYSQP